jgi:outer membrane protein TolC
MTNGASPLALMTMVATVLLTGPVFGQQAPPAPPPAAPEPLPISSPAPAGSVAAAQTVVPGTSGVNTLSGSVQIQGVFQGSTPTGVASREALPLDLGEAVRRGLAYNIGVIGATEVERDALAGQREARAELLPDVTGTITAAVEQVSLATLGLQSAKGLQGVPLARVLGPFNFFDAGAVLSQRVFDLTAIRNYRATKEITTAAGHSVRDNRDLVVLAVSGAYLQVVSAAARVDSARAQVETARAVFAQATRQNQAGVNARIDVDRSQVELQTQRLRLISLETDLATQKLALGRLIGLPLGQDVTLTTTMEYTPPPDVNLQEALATAAAGRADLQAAEAQVRAARQALDAAKAQNVPALAVNGGYFVAGVNPAQSNGVFSVFATIDFPIWRGGRIQASIAAAEAVYAQRRAEYEDVRGRIDVDVRTAVLQLAATTEQVTVAESNRSLAQSTLLQARHRFAAGVADTVEVVQAQESVASAEQDYIASLYAHSLARLGLARAYGQYRTGGRDAAATGRSLAALSGGSRALERAVALARSDRIDVDDLPAEVADVPLTVESYDFRDMPNRRQIRATFPSSPACRSTFDRHRRQTRLLTFRHRLSAKADKPKEES